MNVLDLFSGIGGFSLGLERAGMRTVAFCEIDPYCRAVLAKHWPDVPIFDDVREFRGVPADLIAGGFPCQDISIAGRGAGIEGSRSGLWSEYARIIGEVRPRYVIVENVAALLGRGLERVLGDLAALGFDAEWHCIPASAVGAPHRRDRVWIVADADKSRPQGWLGAELRKRLRERLPRTSDPFPHPTSERWDAARAEQSEYEDSAGPFGEPSRSDWWQSEPGVGGSLDGFPQWLDRCIGRGLSHAESGRRTQVLRGLWSVNVSQALRLAAGGLERLAQADVLFSFVREYEKGADEARLLVAGKKAPEAFLRSLRQRGQARSAPRRPKQGKQRSGKHSDLVQSLPRFLAHDGKAYWAGSGWEDAVPRVANGIPARVDRLRTLGNAVVPEIPEIIGRVIMKLEEAA